MAAIIAKDLNFSYGLGKLKKQILFNVEMEVPEGEIVLMVGPSGGGKTTLLTLIGTLRAVQMGSLVVLGKELSGASERSRRKLRTDIGFIFQAHNLMSFLTAAQNVSLPLELRGMGGRERHRRITEILAAVGLSEHGHKYPDQLSGGQRQRVAIARALVGRPQLVLADEPTAALDSHSGREVVDQLQRLAREQGTTVLVVTHDPRIQDIADRLVHLEDGRLESNGKIASNAVTKPGP
jgi:putative ABC transport system ATP-binding protein